MRLNMENIKERMPIILAVIIAIGICIGTFYFLEGYEETYYTQIDNTKIEQVSSSDNMKFEYTLVCYNERGKKKEIKFKTSRELRENAYLMLKVRVIGVHSWEEIQYNELPDKVKTNYSK